MRYAFGLVGLLVGVAILVWVFAEHTAPVAKVAKKEQEKVRQMSGRDEATGEDASRALTLEPAQRGSKVIGVKVTAVVPGSAMEKFYGIKADDVVTQAGDMPLGDTFGGGGDVQLAAGMILEAFKASKPLTVQRGGLPITLPQQAAVPPVPSAPAAVAGTGVDPFASPAASGTTPPAPPAPPANQKQAPTQQGGLQSQLDKIRNAGGGGQ